MIDLEIGNIVRLRTGKSPLRVEWVGRGEYGLRYLSDKDKRQPLHYRSREELVSLRESENSTNNINTFGEENMANTPSQGDLFVTKEETPRYGTYVGQHGNKTVLAMKDDKGAIEAFEDDAISEVRPFTVSAKGLHSGSQIHLQVTEGSVEKGDVLVYEGQFVMITALDTKCRNPVQFKGRKVVLAEV